MINNYLTAGELARLAGTTKRTIQFYDQKGVLKPAKVNTKGYRLYHERQVLEYQMILLLSTLGVSLAEMKSHLKKRGDLSKLFHAKKHLIQNEIERLQFNLHHIETYVLNLKKSGTMVHPTIKTIKPFALYYIEKVGSYAQIGEYCRELSSMFEQKGKKLTTLAIFEDQGYRPKESRIKIGVLAQKGMSVKREYQHLVRHMSFRPGKVITNMYRGPGEMLSLFWKELEKYCHLKGIRVRTTTPDFEIYWEVHDNPIKQRFEICLPIK